ncbi:HAD family hydrolase [Microbacterium sp. KSW-18]|uniref:HAD family hydrolase n=1 Tax=Microbacterium aquilitoris TaxID=3067307 RepID=A0ABU3GFS7_9MICO|nr:HAD family hydrolase [Microbacterium sp. KSW-18]MDT3329190.1 HAD family hydrolase [Microbacterium sp. KSW-18]
MIRAVGFDLDGTLFDHRGAAETSAARFLASRGAAVTPAAVDAWFAAEATHFERWRSGRIDFAEQRRARLRDVFHHLGLPVPSGPAELDALFASYLDDYRDAWAAYPGTHDLLRDLGRRGYRLGLLTNGSTEQQTDKLDAVGLADLFDATCISEQLGHHKPDPAAFAALVERLGVRPDECLFVGDDATTDAAGARAAGLTAVLIDRTTMTPHDVEVAVLRTLAG